MLGQSMIAIQKPGYAGVCRYGGAAVFVGGYSCLPSQIDAAAFNCDFTVRAQCLYYNVCASMHTHACFLYAFHLHVIAFGLPCNSQMYLTLPNNSRACGIPTGAHNDFNLYCENCTVSFETQWYNHVGTNLDVQMTRENNQSTAYVSAYIYITCMPMYH